ncbi:MAG: ABC transporter ATP-binding protein [Clostridia bacterium]|nr:ABC transporter ATP-binding protein [Clostridia bacterium]
MKTNAPVRGGRGARGGKRPPAKKGTLRRVIKSVFHFYPGMMTVALLCIIFNAVVSALPSLFMQRIFTIIGEAISPSDGASIVAPESVWAVYGNEVVTWMCILIGLYVLSLISGAVNKQLMAIITQGYLAKMRNSMFDGMQDLPVRFFDTNGHGDIMSYYTNDIDTLRQMVAESLPQLLTSAIMVLTLFAMMLFFSLWLTLIVVVGIVFILLATKFIGGGARKYFVAQQHAVAKTEGFIEEYMNGQKVVKVFCHEEEAKRDFDKVNDYLCDQSNRANRYANMLMPILGNIGHVIYVIIAVAGGLFILNGVSNVGIGVLFDESLAVFSAGALVVPFLQLSRQFSNNINQVSQQLNSVVMGLAGASRVFDLIDQKAETDEGYVTLVNAKEDENGVLTECDEHTGLWAWRHPHQADGTVTYTKLTGDIVLENVDFGYTEDKIVLHDVSLYAKPGQKVAFVGATGAGKTTITNLLTRFYDIADGKIRYDGINVNKIKKGELRRAIGMILQDTNLFTGTVMDNIRYGRLDASDEDCIAAAKLAGADDFITRLPEGYNTMLHQNGANLSQGQRQLLSIARAAVADPPVMIMDEATSSIDTRTEAIVQRGMDKLMEGRTVFVIAHRLSTVKNSNAIMVLDHGKIIERGTHEQLIAQKGQYYQLYTGAFELE